MIILIADDDRRARLSLKSMISDLYPNGILFAEASDGSSMIKQFRLYNPDIVFVDIDMPNLDGISAIRECKSEDTHVQFVVLTGHSEFSFAQKCIVIGVSDYVLKPIEPDYLLRLLKKLEERISHDRFYSNSLFQVQMYEAFNLWEELGVISPEPDITQEASAHYCGMLINIDLHGANQSAIEAVADLRIRLNVLGRKRLYINERYCIISAPDGTLRAIFRCTLDQTEQIRSSIAKMIQELNSREILIQGVYMEAASSNELFEKFKCVERTRYRRIASMTSEMLSSYEDAVSHESDWLLMQLYSIFEAYQDMNEPLFCKLIQHVQYELGNREYLINWEKLCHYTYICLDQEISCCDIVTYLRTLASRRELMFYKQETQAPADKVDLAKEIIHARYIYDISIELVAEQIGITPNYLSRIFREKTGERFTDYLTRIRIANAKRLLISSPDLLIKDVAFRSGYYSARHFSTVFKKITGCYPAEYRESRIRL